MRFFWHVDDRAFVGAEVAVVVIFGIDAAGGDPAGGLGGGRPVVVGPGTGPVGFERGPIRQVGVEQYLQIGPQRGQFGPQARYFVGRLRPQFRYELTAQLSLHRQLDTPGARISHDPAAGRIRA